MLQPAQNSRGNHSAAVEIKLNQHQKDCKEMNIEQLRKDMEAGTQGDWEFSPRDPDEWGSPDEVKCGDVTICCNTQYYPTGVWANDQRRIARVPQLERIALAAEALADATIDCDVVFGGEELDDAVRTYREATK